MPASNFNDFPGLVTNFETLKRAVLAGDTALVMCTDIATRKPQAVICTITLDEDEKYNMIPFAKMFMDNPYEEVLLEI